ncbi:unnamed protein product [Symbiodinium natans]|uniref:Uncharacterized protein n=1 Tax=Symbiodinium natans TaxID=878477 RepID=A0A812MFZ9_9DINO|nr:unnamed protein product [Symbiodinium natans]
METIKGWMERAQNLLNKDQKFILGMLFTACLNWADFVSDWYVILQYGCVLGHDLSTSCDGVDPQAECEVHGWWFGLGLVLLIGSNVVQSALWSFFSSEEVFGRRRIKRMSWCEWMAKLGLLFVMGLCQLHYLVDIQLAVRRGAPSGGDETVGIILRELATKIGESAPQLYLQSYVLFAVGAHGSPMKMFSVVISIMALAHGIIKTMGMFVRDSDVVPLEGFLYRVVAGIWLATDQGLRSAAIALVLSAEARLYGSMLLAAFMALSSGVFYRTNLQDNSSVWRDDMPDTVLVRCLLLLLSLLCGYVVPALWMHDVFHWSQPAFDRVVAIRWVEMAACALLALLLAKNVCGYTPDREVAGLVGLLVFNMLCYFCLRCCFEETGELKWPLLGRRTSEKATEACEPQAEVISISSFQDFAESEEDANARPECKKEELGTSNADFEGVRLPADHEAVPVPEGVSVVLLTGDVAGEGGAEMKPFKGKKKARKIRKVRKTKEVVAESASPGGEAIGKGQFDEEADKSPTSPKGKVAKSGKKSKKEATLTVDETAIGKHQEDAEEDAD